MIQRQVRRKNRRVTLSRDKVRRSAPVITTRSDRFEYDFFWRTSSLSTPYSETQFRELREIIQSGSTLFRCDYSGALLRTMHPTRCRASGCCHSGGFACCAFCPKFVGSPKFNTEITLNNSTQCQNRRGQNQKRTNHCECIGMHPPKHRYFSIFDVETIRQRLGVVSD